jgi:hypothetical protein
MRYRLERLRRRGDTATAILRRRYCDGDTATFSSNVSSLRPLPGAVQLVALHRRITDAGALEDGEYLWKQTIRSAGRAAADTDMPSGRARTPSASIGSYRMRQPKPNETDQYSAHETQQRFERLVKAALNTKPKPLKMMGRKGVPAQSKKRRGRVSV